MTDITITPPEVITVTATSPTAYTITVAQPAAVTVTATSESHLPVTIGTANGLTLATQTLSLGLASAGVTGALSGSDWSTFNAKEPAITVLTAAKGGTGANNGAFVLTFSETMSAAGRNVENTFSETQDVTVTQAGAGVGVFEKALNVKLNTTSSYNAVMSAIEVQNNFTGNAVAAASSLYGIHVNSGNNGSGFANHIIGIKIEEVTNTGMTAGNMWGLYIKQPLTASTGGNSAIHIEGVNGSISFAGDASGTLASKIFSPSAASLTIQATTLTLTATTATASGTLAVSGRGSFGQALDANVQLAVTKPATTNIGAAQRGLYVQISSSGTGTFTDNVMGAFYQSNHAGSGNAATVLGGQFATGKTGSGNLTTASGIRLQQSNSNATGTITNSYAIEILSPTVTGAITNNYGIYINAQTGGGTLNYSIYTGQATSGARFGHQITINGSTDVIQSRILAHSTQTANIATWESSAAAVYVKISGTGVFFPRQATTAAAPAYVLGGMYYDTTLNKLRIGGAVAWETVTSV